MLRHRARYGAWRRNVALAARANVKRWRGEPSALTASFLAGVRVKKHVHRIMAKAYRREKRVAKHLA